MRRLRLPLLAGALAATLALVAAPIADASTTPPVAGGQSSGDPYFPRMGDSGYNALHYDIALRYEPHSRALVATAGIRVRPKVALKSLSLDLRGLHVFTVSVDGVRTRFHQDADKLLVRPAHALRRGHAVTIDVRYSGTTGRPIDDTDSLFGWVSTPRGALVVSEAYGAPTWYPVNDSPADKATYSFRVKVPRGKQAIANGLPVGKPVTRGKWTTYRYAETAPMSSYLATVAIGDYTIKRFTKRGLPYITAVDEHLAGSARTASLKAIAKQPAIIDYFSKRFGAYPFTSAGSIVDSFDIGYALETQTRPIYAQSASETTVAHETAHMWFGDSVTPKRWHDVWLSEGFATYAEWVWDDHAGIKSMAATLQGLRDLPATDVLWKGRVDDPGPSTLYNPLVYERGALTLVALRQQVGGPVFDRILRTWVSEHAYGNASTTEFIALSEKLSGQDLSGLFTTWLHTAGKPTF